MATSLLLEGEDLEALLVRAHQEGGPAARIVRAEKVRRGGFLGFFAREAFEVAVEIADTAADGAADGAAGEAERDAGMAAGDAGMAAGHAGVAAGHAGVAAGDAGVAAGDAARPGADGHLPEPRSAGLLAAHGVAAVADRVSAAEQAAAAALLRQHSVRARSGAALASSVYGGSASRTPAGPSLATALLDRADSPQDVGGGPAAVPHGVPHEPPADPVQPSTSRPAFSALLDQLRGNGNGLPATGVPASGVPAMGVPPQRGGSHETITRIVLPVTDEAEGVEYPGVPGSRLVPAPSRPSASTPPATDHPTDHSSDQLSGPLSDQLSDQPSDQPPHQPPDQPPDLPPDTEQPPTPRRPVDTQLAADRRVLRSLGVPSAWTRRLRSGDRFSAVLRMMTKMPQIDMDPDAPVVAVVGLADSVVLEAHRTAVDLATGAGPRPVVVVPAHDCLEHDVAVVEAAALAQLVAAVQVRGFESAHADEARRTLRDLRAHVVIAVLDATRPLEDNARWLEDLGRVDALAVEGATDVPDPARALALDIPVIRLDGVPVDHVTWTALLCAQLELAGRSR